MVSISISGWDRKPRPDFALRVSGPHFRPFADDGDYLLVRRQSTLSHGDLGVFLLDGKYRAMRLYFRHGSIKLVPMDIDQPPIDIDSLQGIACLGKVIGVKTQ